MHQKCRQRLAARTIAALAISLSLFVSGCVPGGAPPKVPQALSFVEAALAQAPLLLEAARAAELLFFALHPDPATQAKVDQGIAVASLAASGAAQALAGVDDITHGQSVAAFSEWNKAWDELLVVLQAAHIASPDPGGAHMAAALPGGTTIRLPLHPISTRL